MRICCSAWTSSSNCAQCNYCPGSNFELLTPVPTTFRPIGLSSYSLSVFCHSLNTTCLLFASIYCTFADLGTLGQQSTSFLPDSTFSWESKTEIFQCSTIRHFWFGFEWILCPSLRCLRASRNLGRQGLLLSSHALSCYTTSFGLLETGEPQAALLNGRSRPCYGRIRDFLSSLSRRLFLRSA